MTHYSLFVLFLMNIPAERIFVGRSHVARVAEARLEQINRYCQVMRSSVCMHGAHTLPNLNCYHGPL